MYIHYFNLSTSPASRRLAGNASKEKQFDSFNINILYSTLRLYTGCAFKSALQIPPLLHDEVLLAPSILCFLATSCSAIHAALNAALVSALYGGFGGTTYPAMLKTWYQPNSSKAF
jgi:hypothetical protein